MNNKQLKPISDTIKYEAGKFVFIQEKENKPSKLVSDFTIKFLKDKIKLIEKEIAVLKDDAERSITYKDQNEYNNKIEGLKLALEILTTPI